MLSTFDTHAHLDHCGYIPVLVKNGFNGIIYCTPPTLELTKIILLDSAKIQEEESIHSNKYAYTKHHPAQPLYSVAEAENSFKYFRINRKIKNVNHEKKIISMPFKIYNSVV